MKELIKKQLKKSLDEISEKLGIYNTYYTEVLGEFRTVIGIIGEFPLDEQYFFQLKSSIVKEKFYSIIEEAEKSAKKYILVEHPDINNIDDVDDDIKDKYLSYLDDLLAEDRPVIILEIESFPVDNYEEIIVRGRISWDYPFYFYLGKEWEAKSFQYKLEANTEDLIKNSLKNVINEML